MYLKVKSGSLLARFEGLTTCELGARLIGSVLSVSMIILSIGACILGGIMLYKYLSSPKETQMTSYQTIRDAEERTIADNTSPTESAVATTGPIPSYLATVWEKTKKIAEEGLEWLAIIAVFVSACCCWLTWANATSGVLRVPGGEARGPLFQYLYVNCLIPPCWFKKIWVHTTLPAIATSLFLLISTRFPSDIYYHFHRHDYSQMVGLLLIVVAAFSVTLVLVWGAFIFLVDSVLVAYFLVRENIYRVKKLEVAAKRGVALVQEARATRVGTVAKFSGGLLHDFYHKVCRKIVVEPEPQPAKAE